MKHTPEEKQRYVDQFRSSIEEGERLVKGRGRLMSPILMDARGINGHLVLLESGIRIKRSDPLVFLTQGVKGDKEIPFPQIASIELKRAGAFANGYIRFSLLEGREAEGGAGDASRDENTVTFKAAQQSAFEGIKAAIEAKVAAARTAVPHQPHQAMPQTTSYIDELEKLASLKDRGIISEEEFTAKKRQILGI